MFHHMWWTVMNEAVPNKQPWNKEATLSGCMVVATYTTEYVNKHKNVDLPCVYLDVTGKSWGVHAGKHKNNVIRVQLTTWNWQNVYGMRQS